MIATTAPVTLCTDLPHRVTPLLSAAGRRDLNPPASQAVSNRCRCLWVQIFGRSRTTTILVTLSALGVMVAAVGFARSDQSLRVADDAVVVRHAERGRAASATYRANLAIAVVAAVAESPASAGRAIEAAAAALDEVVSASDQLAQPRLGSAIDDLVVSHNAATVQLEAGRVDSADTRVSNDTLPLLDDVQREFGRVASEAAARIEAERASAGQTARVSSFIVALLAPALMLWAYRRSAQRRLEGERLTAELHRQRDLADAQRSLISGMSHQLRTPLTGIYGFAEALVSDTESGGPDPIFVSEAGRTILGEANRLRAMVDDILVTARLQSDDLAFEHVPFKLHAEVEAACEPFMRSGGSITIECDEATLLGDRLRVRHVLRNLVDNAFRHGNPPVRVTVHSDKGVLLTIEDEGDALPDGDLFQSFVHSGEDALVTGSLGLGLGVCRALCEEMGVDLDLAHRDGVTRATLRWDTNAILESQVSASTLR